MERQIIEVGKIYPIDVEAYRAWYTENHFGTDWIIQGIVGIKVEKEMRYSHDVDEVGCEARLLGVDEKYLASTACFPIRFIQSPTQNS